MASRVSMLSVVCCMHSGFVAVASDSVVDFLGDAT